ncbi:MAG: DUF6510 family protein [Thermomicrobiales bacterium]
MVDTDERDTRLDGNVAAGLLSEAFCREPSRMVIACSGCGAVAPMGSLLAYGLEMGAILRCPTCDTAVLRAGSIGHQLWVDLRGAVSVRIEIGS